MKIKILPLLLAIIICQSAGAIGSLATISSVNTWYADLIKPSFNPPGWVFGPVWLTLYTLMGIAVYLVWQQGIDKKEVKTALIIFAVQLILNSLWSILFFGLQQPFYAFIEIIILWTFILMTILRFLFLSRTAGWLLIPYFFWTSFAAFLNFTFFRLNR